ncbi:M20 metallopeptidase family protein [Facilibium subflavum]|uniref:M20 metallopeptidase family protein n=1 Tax=Facilibium subflavum TaxID=2219058 RepID=UPI000E657831|nr:amidohydrolase [Facilibium subflavum]
MDAVINKKKVQAVREHIHQYPELGFDVDNTADFLIDELNHLGLKVTRGLGKTGFVADLVVPGAKRMIALRADMDALPIQEKNTCDYKSKIDGKAHMCGHDAHCAMLIGAAEALVKCKEQLNVSVRFLFQPSEEVLPGGAPAMIADGALDSVDQIFGIHVMPAIEEGKLQICQPVALSGVDLFDIEFIGKGGHASLPEITVDPMIMATQFVNQVQSIVSRNISSFEPAVVSITSLHIGSAYNVIADTAQLKGCVRYLSQKAENVVKTRLFEIAQGVASTYGGRVNIDYQHGYPETRNHEDAIKQAIPAAEKVFGKENVLLSDKPWMASEDFSYYAQKIPACYVFLGVRNAQKGFTAMVHEPTFDLSIDAMMLGVNYYVWLIRMQQA